MIFIRFEALYCIFMRVHSIILEMSGCYPEQGFRPESSTQLDLSSIDGTSCYCDASAASELRSIVSQIPLEAVHWIDSGDYHYLTLFFLERIAEPFALLLLDHHDDDQPCAFGDDILSCGSWVREARENLPLLKHVCTVKSSSDRIDIPQGLPVYVSLDKDVMSRDYARTDWDQGEMTLAEVKAVIASTSGTHRVIGIDICGEISSAKGACAEDVDINLRTNLELDDFFVNLHVLIN